jgi:hypothetical protein
MQEHLYILLVGESSKTVTEGQFLHDYLLMIRREEQAEFYSHIMPFSVMGQKSPLVLLVNI